MSSQMQREIAEIPAATARLLLEAGAPLRAAGEALARIDPRVVVTIARGSSDHVATYLKYAIELMAGVPVAVGRSVSRLDLWRTPVADRRRGHRRVAERRQSRYRVDERVGAPGRGADHRTHQHCRLAAGRRLRPRHRHRGRNRSAALPPPRASWRPPSPASPSSRTGDRTSPCSQRLKHCRTISSALSTATGRR